MKIGLLFNCQGNGIAQSLRALLPSATITNVMMSSAAHDADGRRQAQALAGFDNVLAMNIAHHRVAPLISAFRGSGTKVHKLPSFRFAGFHPDTIYIMLDSGGKLLGPTHGYHSRLAVIGYLAGLPADETVGLYNKLSYRRLKYFDEYAIQMALLRDAFRTTGINLDEILNGVPPQKAFMHIFNHPKVWPLLEIARAACRKMDVTIENNAVTAADLHDDLASAPTHPVFPEIAEAIGVEPEGVFKAGATAGVAGRTHSLAEFVKRSFQVFAKQNIETLLNADGVKSGLEAMRLQVSERVASGGSLARPDFLP